MQQYNQELEKKKKRKELERQKSELENLKLKLKDAYNTFLMDKAKAMFEQLSDTMQEELISQFDIAFERFYTNIEQPYDECKWSFIASKILSKEERDYERWILKNKLNPALHVEL